MSGLDGLGWPNPEDEPRTSRERIEQEPLPRTTCSRYFLEIRWYDSQWEKWTEWEEVSGRDLRVKYGCNPEEWKESCKTWIEVGGCYEYRIGTRTDVTEWEISYRENATVEGPAENATPQTEKGN